jgi:hypothetical protein
VINDVDGLKKKLLNQSKIDKTLVTTRNISEISDKIVWMNQLEMKLKFYQEKVRQILGEDWQSQQEGMDLAQTCGALQQKIQRQIKEVFTKWTNPLGTIEYSQLNDNKVLVIQQRGSKLQLVPNIDEDILRLFKEKNSLNIAISHFNLALSISHFHRFKADEFQKYQPIAISLQQSLRTFQVTINKCTDEFEMLIAKKKAQAQESLFAGLTYQWKQEQYVKKYCHKVLVKVIDFESEVFNMM